MAFNDFFYEGIQPFLSAVQVHEYISLTQLGQILAGFLSFAMLAWTLNHSVSLIADLQKVVYKKKWNSSKKHKLELLLRLLKPNASWFISLLIYITLPNIVVADNIGLLLFYELVFLYAVYKLVLLLVIYSVERVYKLNKKYVPVVKLKHIHIESTKLTRYFIVMLFFVDSIHNNFSTPLFLYSSLLLIFGISYSLYIKILEEHREALILFTQKQLPESIELWFKKRDIEKRLDGLFVLVFMFAHMVKNCISVHEVLLKFDAYKLITAKILWLHLEQMQDEEDEDIITDERYEKWFSSAYSPVEIVKTETGQAMENTLNEVIERWVSGKALENDLLLSGASGSGKTVSIKSWIEHKSEEMPVHYISVPAKVLKCEDLYELLNPLNNTPINSIEELIAIDSCMEKSIVVLDNSHNLFLSDINGFVCYKTLLNWLNAPLKNLFFIIIMADDPCIYLNDVFLDSQQYSYVIELKPWQVEEIKELIMYRHKASKRKLEFDELLFASMGNDELTAYSATADRCFRMVWEQSGGNPALALSIWVRAASKKERFTIEIGLPEKPSAGFLSEYAVDHLFVYSSLVRHQNLTISESVRSTRLPETVVRRAFKLGRDVGFMVSEDDERYRMHAFWAFQIISFLRIKNFLHGK